MISDELTLLTVNESAALLRLSPRSLYDPRFRKRHGLLPLRLGRALRFRVTDLQSWLDHAVAERGVDPTR